MKLKLTAALLCILGALGLLNIGQSLKNWLFHDHSAAEKVHVASYHAGDEVVLERRFEVANGQSFEVSLSHAHVNIRTADPSEAHIKVLLSGRDMAKAREYFESLNFTIEQDGDRIIVRTQPRRQSWSWDSKGGARIEVQASIPRRFNADLRLSHGDLNVGDLVGNMNLRSSHGDVTLGSIDGSAVEVVISHGDVKLGSAKADRISIRNSHGDLEGGPIGGERISLGLSHGDITLAILGASDLEVSNSHGDIELDVAGPIGGSIRNSHGDIELEVGSNFAATVELRASEVSIADAYSFEGRKTSKLAEGTLNGGGPMLKAHTSHGSIDIR